MENNKQPAFKVESIFLLESASRRDAVIDFVNTTVHQDTKIDKDSHPTQPDGKFSVLVTVLVTGINNDKTVYEMSATMAGVFSKHGESALPDEIFKTVNAPAIIYPFVREHIASLATKSGVGSILLAPVNFIP